MVSQQLRQTFIGLRKELDTFLDRVIRAIAHTGPAGIAVDPCRAGERRLGNLLAVQHIERHSRIVAELITESDALRHAMTEQGQALDRRLLPVLAMVQILNQRIGARYANKSRPIDIGRLRRSF
ncbi:hypothetical protein D3C72_1513850 [compost metagenome]